MSFHFKLKSIFVLLFLLSFTVYFCRNPKEITTESHTIRISTPASLTDLSEKLEKSKVLQVLVLAVNPRSGSSYLAEILASTPLTSLWQEPLRFLYEKPPVIWYVPKKNTSENSTIKDKRYRKYVPTSEKLQMISDFMKCNFEDYLDLLASQVSRQFVFKLPDFALGRDKGRLTPLMLSKIYLPKTIKNCQKSKIRIMKTIRLEVTELGNYLEKFSNLKVIFLVRDPRAIINSIHLSPDFWPEENRNSGLVCHRNSRNFLAAQKLQIEFPNKIQILKYEDFIDNRLATIEKLYDFLNISYLLPYAKNNLKIHTQKINEPKWDRILEGEKMPKAPKALTRFSKKVSFQQLYSKLKGNRKRKFFKAKKINTLIDHGSFRYYSTFRSEDFKHDHWKEELSAKHLKEIQTLPKCQNALKLLNYSLLTNFPSSSGE